MKDVEQSPVHWYNSIVVRIIALCVVLVVCLFGSVYVISYRYFDQVIEEVEEVAEQIADSATIVLKETPNISYDELENKVEDLHEGVVLDFGDLDTELQETQISTENMSEGRVMVAHHPIRLGDRLILLTAWVTPRPTTGIVRAFKNKYLALLSALFIVALGLLVYVIAKTLRPLHDLSETCSQISEGNLIDVQVRKNAGEILALEQTFNRMVGALREKEVVEANLRQAQRLSAIGNLAAGVAHDVRNPLNAIKLLSSHARDSLGENAEHEATKRQLDTIRSEVNRLEEIVSGFLSLAKEREIRPEPTRIDAILTECVRLVKQDAEARKIRLLIELRAGDTELSLDPKQWTRAILNVLLNAMDACPEGGRVRLFSRLTDTSCQIEVRDDGPGMAKDVVERVFDPYFTTRPTGTGLGLSITRGIVEEHGGTIQLSSEEGRGCQVLITVPLETISV